MMEAAAVLVFGGGLVGACGEQSKNQAVRLLGLAAMWTGAAAAAAVVLVELVQRGVM